MLDAITLVVALLIAVFTPGAQARESQVLLSGTNGARRESPAQLLASSKTLLVIAPATKPVLDAAICNKLSAWGRLTLVSRWSDADLVLDVRQMDAVRAHSDFRDDSGGGVQHTASVWHRQSGVRIWSTITGGSWPLNEWGGAWTGRGIADGFIKFFDKSVRQVEKKTIASTVSPVRQ